MVVFAAMSNPRMAIALVSVVVLAAAAPDRPLYKDSSQPVEARVADLLSRMTLEEKVAQTLGIWKDKERITEDDGTFSPEKATKAIPDGIGEISRPTELRDKPKALRLGPRENAVFLNAVQKWL